MEMEMDDTSNEEYGKATANTKRKTALFQLFDWHHKFLGKKKLFSSKLPQPEVAEVDTTPEKVKHAGKKSKDEKLPMAKLLLIAEEENRGGFPAVNRLSPKMESRLISKGDSPKRVGNNGGKRRPSVVARLMGLDTMPSPDPAGKESALQRKAMEVCPSRNPQRQSLLPSVENTHIPVEELKKKKLPKRPTTKDQDKEEEEKGLIPYIDVGRSCPKALVDDPAILFSKLPSLLPRNGSNFSPLRSILSPSKSHNRLASPIRSPLSAKKSAAIFIETAAAKILEPKMQPCSKNRSSNNASIRSSAVRHLLMGSSDVIEDHKSERKVSKNTTRALSRGGKASSRFSSRQSTEKAGEKEEELVGKTGSLGRKEGAEKALFSTADKVEQPNQRRREQRQQQLTTTSKPPPKREKAGSSSISSTTENLTVKEHRLTAKMGSSKTSDSLLQKWDQAKPRTSNSSLARQDLSSATEPVRKQGGGSKISKGGRSNLPEITILAPSVEGIHDSSVLRTSSNNGGILSYSRLFRSNRDGTHNKEEKEEISSKKGGGGESSVMKSWLRRRASLESMDSIDKSTKDSKSRKNNNPSQFSSKSTSAQCKAPPPPPKVLDRLAPKKDTDISKEEIEISKEEISNSNSSNNEKDLCMWANANDDLESTFKATSLPLLQSIEPVPVRASEEDAKEEDDEDDDDDENDDCDDDGDDNDGNEDGSKKDEGSVLPGKTTAAILEELLTALNKSRLHFPFSENSRELTLLSERNADAFEETNCHPSSIPSDQPHGTIAHGIHSAISEERSTEDVFSNSSNSVPPDSKLEETDTVATSLLMPERDGDLHHRISNEDEYVREIVSVPLLSFEDTVLFNELEERIERSEPFSDPFGLGNGLNKAPDQVSKMNRKLVFDCVLEVLKLGLGCGNGDNMSWLKASSFSSLCPPKRDNHVLVKSVCKQIEEWRDMMNSVLLDDLVEKDRIFSGKWQSFDMEASELGLELERSLFGALIEDLVEDFAT